LPSTHAQQAQELEALARVRQSVHSARRWIACAVQAADGVIEYN
jgi:hypothetical protein